MEGTGVPLVTPFDEDGEIAGDKLRSLVRWLDESGVDFLVPCGSNGESELLTVSERATVIEEVIEESSIPVLAGTGHPGFAETREQTARAAEAGADGALVVTPHYYQHDQDAIERYYERLADESGIPIYLYSVPGKTQCKLEPETVATLSRHPNVRGIKDSSGDLVTLTREHRLANDDFELFIGNGSLYAQGLDAGVTGGILALANVVPDLAARIYRHHRQGEPDGARALNADLVDLNQAVTARYGIPGLKAAMQMRGVSAGHLRSPFSPVRDEPRQELESLLANATEERSALYE